MFEILPVPYPVTPWIIPKPEHKPVNFRIDEGMPLLLWCYCDIIMMWLWCHLGIFMSDSESKYFHLWPAVITNLLTILACQYIVGLSLCKLGKCMQFTSNSFNCCVTVDDGEFSVILNSYLATQVLHWRLPLMSRSWGSFETGTRNYSQHESSQLPPPHTRSSEIELSSK